MKSSKFIFCVENNYAEPQEDLKIQQIQQQQQQRQQQQQQRLKQLKQQLLQLRDQDPQETEPREHEQDQHDQQEHQDPHAQEHPPDRPAQNEVPGTSANTDPNPVPDNLMTTSPAQAQVNTSTQTREHNQIRIQVRGYGQVVNEVFGLLIETLDGLLHDWPHLKWMRFCYDPNDVAKQLQCRHSFIYFLTT